MRVSDHNKTVVDMITRVCDSLICKLVPPLLRNLFLRFLANIARNCTNKVSRPMFQGQRWINCAYPWHAMQIVRYAYKFLIRWWLRSISCSRLTVTIHNLSTPWRGWGAEVQKRLFWLAHSQGNYTTVRCSVQMTTTKSSSATSCCEYGVLNRQLQGCREPRCLCWS